MHQVSGGAAGVVLMFPKLPLTNDGYQRTQRPLEDSRDDRHSLRGAWWVRATQERS